MSRGVDSFSMYIFLDTADVQDIRALAETGLVDGVTTNPSLLSKVGRSPVEVLKEICAAVPGPVSAEVTASAYADMVVEAKKLHAIAPNIVIKVPITPDGLKVCRVLHSEGIPVNATLCFSVPQALLAAKAGAAYVSPFIGRIDDHGGEGADLLHDIRSLYDLFPDFPTKILAASIRTMHHVTEAALAGCDCITMPPSLFRQMYQHPLTVQGLEIFARDWEKVRGL